MPPLPDYIYNSSAEQLPGLPAIHKHEYMHICIITSMNIWSYIHTTPLPYYMYNSFAEASSSAVHLDLENNGFLLT